MNNMKLIKQILVSAASLLALAACAGQQPQVSSVDAAGATYSNQLYAAVGKAQGADHPVFISAPDSTAAVEICYGSECSNYVSTKQIDRRNGRKFFLASRGINPENGIEFTIRAKASGQTAQRQRVQVVRDSNNNNSGNESNEWKVLLIAGDQRSRSQWISAFDNARKKFKEIFKSRGVRDSNIRELTQRPEHQQREGIEIASTRNIERAMQDLTRENTGSCLVWMTSHGSRGAGFNMGPENLDKRDLAAILDDTCGDAPTVVMVSACFSGQYVDYSGLRTPNRIVLSAAHAQRTSFGCSPEATYTYWDTCLIDTIGSSSTFAELEQKTTQCIIRKEGGQSRSLPQKWFGERVRNLKIPTSRAN